MQKPIESQTTQILFQGPTKAEQSNFKPKVHQFLFTAGEFLSYLLISGLLFSAISLVIAMGN